VASPTVAFVTGPPKTPILIRGDSMTIPNLAEEDIAYIEDRIKSQLGEWLTEQSLGKPPVVYEIELRERMVRIEEELKHQRELIKTVLEQMDKRFEATQQNMDKRFEAMQQSMDKRFESMDKRFEAVQQSMDRRFDELTRRIDRFMVWSFATTLTVGGLVVATLKLWP